MYNQYIYKEPAPAPIPAPKGGPLSTQVNYGKGSSLEGTSQHVGTLGDTWGGKSSYLEFANQNVPTLLNQKPMNGYWTSMGKDQGWDPNYISPDEVRYFSQYRNPLTPGTLQRGGPERQRMADLNHYRLEQLPDGGWRYRTANKSLEDYALGIRNRMLASTGYKPNQPAAQGPIDPNAIASQSALAMYQQIMAAQQAQQQQQTTAQQAYQAQLAQQRQAASSALAQRFGYDTSSLGIPTGYTYG